MKAESKPASFEPDARGRLRTALAHGDWRAKNIMVDARGEIGAVLDWEDCCSQPAPLWELAIALHDLTIDDKHAFLDGYGLSVRAVRELAPASRRSTWSTMPSRSRSWFGRRIARASSSIACA